MIKVFLTVLPLLMGNAFEQELDQLCRDVGFPGATAAYLLPDGQCGVAAVGEAEEETRMLGASVGKTFVAATVLALANEGKLSLDAPIANWLGERPWFKRLPNHATITVRHLLMHTAGLPDHVRCERFASLLESEVFSPEALVELILDQPPLFPVGEGWAYTDTGYILLGLIIEQVSEKSYYAQLKERFLEPLGLTQTAPADCKEFAHLAVGHTASTLSWNPPFEWTGGGIVTHPKDLVVWAKELYEGRAFEGEYLEEMLKCVPAGENRWYGAGVTLSDQGEDGKVYGHAGIIPGYLTSMRYYPNYGF